MGKSSLNREEFERELSGCWSSLESRALSLTKHCQEKAEDLLQDTVFKSLQNLGSFRGDASLGTWMQQIMLNIYRNQVKRDKSGYSRHMEFYRRNFDLGSEDPADIVARLSELKSVREALCHIPQRYVEVIADRYEEDLSYEEISQKRGISESMAKMWAYRGTKKIGEILENVA